MTFLGLFLYAKVLDIGYSFIVWAGFAVFALLGGIFTILPHVGSKGRYLPLMCMGVALALAIIAISTPSWFSEVVEQATPRRVQTSNSGVKAYRVMYETYDAAGTNVINSVAITSSFGSDTFQRKFVSVNPPLTEDLTITKCPTTPQAGNCYDATAFENGRFKEFISGGEKALGCGIPAIFGGVVAIVAMFALLRGSPPQHSKLIAIVASFLSSALAFLGLFLYAAVTSVGASFVVYAAAGFMWVLASCMAFGLLSGGAGGSSSSTSSGKSSAPKKDTTKDKPTTAQV